MNSFFVGIGGMGMSGLAKILQSQGFAVGGSDRNLEGDYCRRLQALGIPIFPQDGSGPETFLQQSGLRPDELTLVKSTAVEDQVPDIVTARRLGLRQIMRSDLLAEMVNARQGIAIGGTAGKTTTSGLMAWVLKFLGLEPSCAIGGLISGLDTNAFAGTGPHFVLEADESDGSIVKYQPAVSVITNISRDHKPLEELLGLFSTFLHNTRPDGFRLVWGDDPWIEDLRRQSADRLHTFGLSASCDTRGHLIAMTTSETRFEVAGQEFCLPLPGRHNLLNALAVVAVGRLLKIPLPELARAVATFPGMKRRFETIGTINGVTVVDDFAHNPVEIAAAIETARHRSKRRFLVYQPHGYGPTRFTRQDLVQVFQNLQDDEFLYLDDIYYGGGTVEKDISSKDIIDEVRERFANAFYLGNRDRIVQNIVQEARHGDMVLVMGARDINQICRPILDSIA